METNFFVETATLKNASELAEFSLQSFYNTYAAFNTPENMEMYVSQAFSIATIEQEIADTANMFLLLRENNCLVGYAKLCCTNTKEIVAENNTLQLARLYIAAEQKGKGYGKFLLQQCCLVAANQHYKSIWLGVWQQNIPAILFYEKMGFSKTGEQYFLLGKDVQTDFVMLKYI